jgi:hypothetical protein
LARIATNAARNARGATIYSEPHSDWPYLFGLQAIILIELIESCHSEHSEESSSSRHSVEEMNR